MKIKIWGKDSPDTCYPKVKATQYSKILAKTELKAKLLKAAGIVHISF